MNKLTAVLLMNLVATANVFAKSPVGDWQAVQYDIPRGWQITVMTTLSFPCIFEQANTDELICDPTQHSRRGSEDREIHVRRDRIYEVRVERREGANMLAGAATAGSTGAVLGAVLAAGARGPSAFLLGIGGGAMGARTGRDLHIVHAKLIYRRSAADASAAPAPALGTPTVRTLP